VVRNRCEDRGAGAAGGERFSRIANDAVVTEAVMSGQTAKGFSRGRTGQRGVRTAAVMVARVNPFTRARTLLHLTASEAHDAAHRKTSENRQQDERNTFLPHNAATSKQSSDSGG